MPTRPSGRLYIRPDSGYSNGVVTKRKPVIVEEPVVAREILEQAKRAVDTDKLRRSAHCSVCNSECAPHPDEQLCWVCRRLKISAWRDSDLQANNTAQE